MIILDLRTMKVVATPTSVQLDVGLPEIVIVRDKIKMIDNNFHIFVQGPSNFQMKLGLGASLKLNFPGLLVVELFSVALFPSTTSNRISADICMLWLSRAICLDSN